MEKRRNNQKKRIKGIRKIEERKEEGITRKKQKCIRNMEERKREETGVQGRWKKERKNE